MNKVRMATIHDIYVNIKRLHADMDLYTPGSNNPRYFEIIKELNDLRIRLDTVMNSVCPVLKGDD